MNRRAYHGRFIFFIDAAKKVNSDILCDVKNVLYIIKCYGCDKGRQEIYENEWPSTTTRFRIELLGWFPQPHTLIFEQRHLTKIYHVSFFQNEYGQCRTSKTKKIIFIRTLRPELKETDVNIVGKPFRVQSTKYAWAAARPFSERLFTLEPSLPQLSVIMIRILDFVVFSQKMNLYLLKWSILSWEILLPIKYWACFV